MRFNFLTSIALTVLATGVCCAPQDVAAVRELDVRSSSALAERDGAGNFIQFAEIIAKLVKNLFDEAKADKAKRAAAITSVSRVPNNPFPLT